MVTFTYTIKYSKGPSGDKATARKTPNAKLKTGDEVYFKSNKSNTYFEYTDRSPFTNLRSRVKEQIPQKGKTVGPYEVSGKTGRFHFDCGQFTILPKEPGKTTPSTKYDKWKGGGNTPHPP